jgi:putative ABC transport system ATP-binding protein
VNQVLEEVSLELSAGQWLTVTGPSGGGKTTLLSLAAGLLNILLPGYFCKTPWLELRDRCEELAGHLQLTDHLDKKVSVLSGGQRQRVAVARALLLRPRLILADEPTGALDRPTAQLVLDLLDAENRKGAALLTVTHDPALLERSAGSLDLHAGRLSSPLPEGITVLEQAL